MLVVALSGTGALVGLSASVTWHVAVAGTTADAAYYARPGWFPSTVSLVGAATAIGLVAASFLVDVGVGISADRSRSRVWLVALLVVFGLLLGSGAGWAWTKWAPQQPDSPIATERVSGPVYWEGRPDGDGPIRLPVRRLIIVDGSDSAVAERNFDQVEDANSRSESAFRPTVERPWLVFPIGGALIAVVVALAITRRDYRLAWSKGDIQAA